MSCPGINDAAVDLLDFQDLYLVFECVDTDLAKLIKDETQVLTEQHIRCVCLARARARARACAFRLAL